MSNRIKIAIFGAGRWGVHLLRNFLQHPQAQVIAVVDPNPACLASVAQQFELDSRIFLTTQWQDALELNGLQAVAIATPAATHYALIVAALKQGLHVLAEKPLTLDAAEAIQLCQLANDQQRQLVVDHTYLFHPAVAKGREVLRSGILGSLRYGYSTRTHLSPVRSDVDALWDLAIHDIAILNDWLSETPCMIAANGQVWLQPAAIDAFPNGIADTVWATLTYPSGFRATMHLSWLNPDKQRRSCIVGEKGSLIFDELAAEPLVVHSGELERQGKWFKAVNQGRSILSFPDHEPLQNLCSHFLNCVQQNQPSEVSPGWLGTELVQILVALSESMQQNGRLMTLGQHVSKR